MQQASENKNGHNTCTLRLPANCHLYVKRLRNDVCWCTIRNKPPVVNVPTKKDGICMMMIVVVFCFWIMLLFWRYVCPNFVRLSLSLSVFRSKILSVSFLLPVVVVVVYLLLQVSLGSSLSLSLSRVAVLCILQFLNGYMNFTYYTTNEAQKQYCIDSINVLQYHVQLHNMMETLPVWCPPRRMLCLARSGRVRG